MFHSDRAPEDVAISPTQPLSWVFFCADTYAPHDFVPAVPDVHWPLRDTNSDMWHSWREMVWADISDPADGKTGPRIPGLDAEQFSSLAEFPALQDTCRQRWDAFVGWWRSAKEVVVAATHDPEVADILRDARGGKERGLTVHVVPLKAAQDIASNGSAHAVSLGLVQDHAALHRWLAHQD
jgi:hypothetical protein